jgi:hypothetical protein
MNRQSTRDASALGVVSVVRHPNAITVCLTERVATLKELTRPSTKEPVPLYASRTVNLAHVHPQLLPWRDEMLRSFAFLAEVREGTAETLEHALAVLLLTVPAAHSVVAPPTLRMTQPSATPKRTAAHPRGFMGTKYKPGKAPRAGIVDARGALCSRKETHRLLTLLWQHRDQSITRLGKRFPLPAAGLARLAALDGAPSDPYVSLWHSGSPDSCRLASEFVTPVLWTVRGADWHEVRRLNGIFERLDLAANQALLDVIVRALVTVPLREALTWLAAIERQPPVRRLEFGTLVLETGVLKHRTPSGLVEALADRTSAHNYRQWAYRTLDYVSQKIDSEYLAAGVRSAAEHWPSYGFWRAGICGDYDQHVIDDLLLLLPEDTIATSAMALWEACGLVPGLMDHLRRLDTGRFTSEQLLYYLRFLTDLRWHDGSQSMTRGRWRAIEESLPAIATMLTAVPHTHCDQASHDLGSALELWLDPASVRRFLPDAVDLVGRVARPPINDNGHIDGVLSAFLEMKHPQLRRRLLDAPLEEYLRLDRACARGKSGDLIAWGLRPLLNIFPVLTVEGFEREPATLFRLAKRLGSQPWEARFQILREWADVPILRLNPNGHDLERLVSAIDDCLRDLPSNVIPRAVRDHLSGKHPLSDRQIARHVERLAKQMTRVRLLALEQHAIKCLCRTAGHLTSDPNVLFALDLLGDAQRNRRGFRRFLRAYLAGNPDYLRDHPASQRWFARHPKVVADRWLNPPAQAFPNCNGGTVTLAFEKDPLEVLRLGNYVGSCLSLGGLQSNSAVATLLDVNKQVVYARDENGTVVGRQIVALSAGDEIVAFSVYPKVSKELASAFREYDRMLSRHLELPLCTGGNYEIEMILARDWWDDGAWNVGPNRKADSISLLRP